MKTGQGGFSQLFKNIGITSKIMAVVLDEGHCISEWSSFRPEYKEIGRLQSILPGIVFHITSATLPDYIIEDVLDTLHICPDNLYTLRRSNARSNVAFVVREIQHSLKSFADLGFLVNSWAGGVRPPKFLILFDNIKESVRACRKLRARLPRQDRDKIQWHNSNMSSDFRSQALDKFRRDEIIGFCATDTLGMVSLIKLYEIYWFIHQVCRAWIFRTSK